MLLDANNLVNYVDTLDDKQLETLARKRRFRAIGTSNGIEITPASSGQPRQISRGMIQRVCDEFEQSKSMKPADYHAITFDASYLLAIIDGFRRR
jgi:hypothetical protein